VRWTAVQSTPVVVRRDTATAGRVATEAEAEGSEAEGSEAEGSEAEDSEAEGSEAEGSEAEGSEAEAEALAETGHRSAIP